MKRNDWVESSKYSRKNNYTILEVNTLKVPRGNLSAPERAGRKCILGENVY